jgi:hypothetical protein
MSIWDAWTGEGPRYTHGMLAAGACAPAVPSFSLQPDVHYVQVTLRRMQAVAARRGFKKLYGAVHSDAGTQHASGELVSFAKLIAPPQLRNVSARDFGCAIITNQTLFGPTPYRGGPIKLNAALLTITSADLLGPYLDILAEVGDAAGAPYVSLAKQFIPTLRHGIDALTQSDGQKSLEIYLVTNLEPRAGVFVVMRTDKATVRLEDLRVAPDFTLSHSAGADISRHPYMVITVDAATHRTDWRAVPELAVAYDGLHDALKRDRPEEAKEAMAVFRRTAGLSDDLIASDAETIMAGAERLYNDTLEATLTASAGELALPTLDEFDPFAEASD